MPPKLRATQRFLAHNASPTRKSRKRLQNEQEGTEDRRESSSSSHHKSPLRKERHSKAKSSYRSESADSRPSWAKKLLKVHQKSHGWVRSNHAKSHHSLTSNMREQDPVRAKYEST